MRLTRRHVLAVVAASISGCQTRFHGDGVSPTRSTAPEFDRTGTPLEAGMGPYRFSYQGPSGNRFVAGSGSLPGGEPVDVSLEVQPAWVVGVVGPPATNWVVAGEDGRIRVVTVRDRATHSVESRPTSLPAGMPPVVRAGVDGPDLLAPPPDASPHSTPLPVGDGSVLFVDHSGDIGTWDGGSVTDRLAVGALPDARLIRFGSERVLALTSATDRYDHGVLGDAIEARRLTMIDSSDGLSVEWHTTVPGVIEGQAPIMAPLSGSRSIIVTVSNASHGARIVAFGPNGQRLATGPPIGSGFRWRHQLAVAPFTPNGPSEVAVVRTPHIGGTIEFYRRDGNRLVITATLDGYASHEIGSRNLDAAVAGDFDGDRIPEIVLPRTDHRTLAGVRRDGENAREAWTLDIGGRLSSNLAAIPGPDGGLALAVGRQDGTLRVWR